MLNKIRNYIPLISSGIFVFFLSSSYEAKATHAMALDLTYRCIGNNEYQFTLSFYRDCQGIPAPWSPTLHIESASCGVHTHINLTQSGPGVEVSAICNSQLSSTSCNGGTLPGVQKYIYTGTYTLPANCADWVFSYSECCRNNLITNLARKNDIYIEATLNNSNSICNSSPEYSTIPVPYICNGQSYSYNHGVVDSDGDSLVYTLINPLEGRGRPAPYQPGYSPTNPILTSGSVQFDNATGQMSLTPNGLQVNVVAMQVKEFRNGILIGTTMRDMQVIVVNCTNTLPYLTNDGEALNHSGGILVSKNIIEVCPGEEVSFDIMAQDDDGDNINLVDNVITVIPDATMGISYSGSTATGNFKWTPTSSDAGIHTFALTITDDACQISGRQTYSFTIIVLPGTYAGPDQFYCNTGGPVQLKTMGGSSFTWTMLDGSVATGLSCTNCSDPLASPLVSSTYVVTSNFSSNCRNKDTVSVFAVSDFNLSKSTDTNLCSLKEGVQISMLPGPDPAASYTYSWSPSVNLSDPSVQNPVARPEVTTKYYATVTSDAGCKKTDSILVTVKGVIDLSIFPGDSVETCDSTQLNLHMIPLGEIFIETFHHEIDSSGWSSISGGIVSNTCGSVADEAYYFNSPGNRTMVTKDLDVSTGGVITFYLKAGSCNQCICDKPENDEQDENLYLEYSIDAGATWQPIEVFNADLYAPKNAFEYIVLYVPDGAKTTSSRFRWQQLNFLNDKDVWILDEIRIREGLSDYSYAWTPTSYLSDPATRNPIAFPNETTTYTVTVTDIHNGCVFTDSIKIKFVEEFDVTTYQEVTYCPGDESFQLHATVPSGNIYTYQWGPNINISDPTIPNPTVAPSASTTYTVVISNPATRCYRREEIHVNVPPAFTVNVMADTSLCKGQSLVMEASVSPADDYDYLWLPNTAISDHTVLSPEIDPVTDTEYILYVKNKATDCIKADTAVIKAYPDFNLETSGTTTLCPDADDVTISATASPGTNYEYLWLPDTDIIDPANPSQVVKPATDKTYYVLCHQLNGCWKKDSAEVKIYNNTLNLQVSNDTIINEEDFATLVASGAESYLWKKEEAILDSFSVLAVSPLSLTTYTIIGSDDCYSDTTEVTVDVRPIDFFIPNLITPNGDGLNDRFEITNFGKRWNVAIYNRWGKLVYQKDQYVNEWKGEEAREGLYFFQISDTRNGKVYEGWLHVVQ